MRFFHLSDLHIGKQMHSYNLREEQAYILGQIVEMAKKLRPDAVVIAGDVYDKSVPSAEAVTVFNQFLTNLSDIRPQIAVMIISGNHDSAERLEYASAILGRNKIYIAGLPPMRPEDELKKVILEDEYGEVCFYLLPFIRPGYVRKVFPEGEKRDTYEEALRGLIEREKINRDIRNVIISHQFYTAGGKEPVRSDSETINVGGLDNIDIRNLEMFDYAALGHIHRRQKIGREESRYCGTPLKYSVSEWSDDKVLTVVELTKKGEAPIIEEIPLIPGRDVRKIRGNFQEILAAGAEMSLQEREDYISVTLTDEGELYQPRERLEEVFPRLLEVRVENTRTKKALSETVEMPDISDPREGFWEFFEEIQGRSMTEEEETIMKDIFEEVRI